MSESYDKMAKVIKVIDDYTIVINRGQNSGLTIGAKYLIFGLGDELTDPDTGESLGQLEMVRGKAEVVHLQPSLATLKSVGKRRLSGTRRIIRKPGSSFSANLLGYREEIEETPEYLDEDLDAVVGDLAKLL